MVRYDRYDILFQEIPDEVSLAFTITNCQNNCKGCHSQHLRNDSGKELTFEELMRVIEEYESSITNILFLGEGNDLDGLLQLIMYASAFKKVSLYSGKDYIEHRYLPWLTYYKVGSYIAKLGGLGSDKTNQILYKINCEDITHKFKK